MLKNIRKQTLLGIAWSAIERFSLQGVQFLVTLVMARFLLPSDYGMIGMLTIFLQLSQILIDSGFANALIRDKERTETDFSTIFYFNILVAVLLYILLFLSATYIADFYGLPQLVHIIRVISLVIILNSLVIVHRTRLIIDIDFKTQSKISFLSAFLSGVIGIWMAYTGYGVWALVVQVLLNGLLVVCFYVYFCRWKPHWEFSISSFKRMYSFGGKLLISNILHTLYKNLYTIVIGKRFSAIDLGYYTRAEQFAQFPSSNLNAIVSRVAYPILSSVQDNDRILVSIYRKYIRVISFVIFPLMIGLAALSKPLVIILLTEKWISIVLMLQILCFDWMFDHISAINLNLLYVKGRSDLALRLEVIKKTIATAILFLSIPFGLIGICLGRVLYSLIATYLNTYYTQSLIGLSFGSQLRDIFPSFFAAVCMGICVYFSMNLFSKDLVQLLMGVIMGILSYLLLSRIFLMSILKELFSLSKK